MQCPRCGNTVLPQFKWCPECGSALPRAQNIAHKIEHGEYGVEPTLQQSASSTTDNSDLGLDNRSIQGKFNISLLGLFMDVKNSIFH